MKRGLLMLVISTTLFVACQDQAASTLPTGLTAQEYEHLPGMYFGAFAAGTETEDQLDTKFAVQMYYHPWGSRFASGGFAANAEKVWLTMATWEFQPVFTGVDDPYIFHPLQSIVDGHHDPYLQQFAQDAKAFGLPVLLRFGHEMNGDWYLWSGTKNGGATPTEYGDPAQPDGPELYVAAYQYIYQLFAAEGAENVLWVWCPNVAIEGELGAAWNHIQNYYPGDEYVDWLCMDGYNWGTSQDWSSWQSFTEVFAETYAQLQTINAEKPIMIGEFATSNAGGDKSAWVRDAFTQLEAFPQIRMIVWFNLNKETDWRMNANEALLDEFRLGLADEKWQSWPGFEK